MEYKGCRVSANPDIFSLLSGYLVQYTVDGVEVFFSDFVSPVVCVGFEYVSSYVSSEIFDE